MHSLTVWFLALFAGVTCLMMAIAIPLSRGWIKPNRIYGVRTAKTLGDEGVWRRSNAYGGRLLFRIGLVQLIAVVALYGVPSLRANFVDYNLACGAVIVGGVLMGLALVIRRVRSL